MRKRSIGERNRMIIDLPYDVQMAIRIRAVKSKRTTGEVVSEAIEKTYPNDVAEARKELANV